MDWRAIVWRRLLHGHGHWHRHTSAPCASGLLRTSAPGLRADEPDFRSAVLNVPGVGWADVLENSSTNAIKCPLVDALIDAGILTGAKWNPMVTPNTGLCTTDAWKAQPGYAQFAAIGRWVLDPADGANFVRRLAAKKVLIRRSSAMPSFRTSRPTTRPRSSAWRR